MVIEVPSLVDLCMSSIRNELLNGDNSNDQSIHLIYEIPLELFDSLLPLLPPLALQKLEENLPLNFSDDCKSITENLKGSRKRKRYGVLDTAWKALYSRRWPSRDHPGKVVSLLDKHGETMRVSTSDWQQIYWETHLQDCLDAVTEVVFLPSYNGLIGEIQITDSILKYIGCKDSMMNLTSQYLKFSYHCQRFSIYARHLRLPNVLCVGETCNLLQSSKLEYLELHWIKSTDHVDGLCELLKQNRETLKSIDFFHCKLSPTFIDAICNSLCKRGLQTHGINHFSIKRSSFMQTDLSPMTVGLATFLMYGRSLHSLTFCDDQLGRNFAGMIFNTLLDASSNISFLDLSENNIPGFLSQFRWKSGDYSRAVGKSLQSLRVLNLRNNNLIKDDVHCLKQALIHMPNLQNLDLSDNPIEDGIRSLITYFSYISTRSLPFLVLKIENCDLTCNDMSQLLEVLSTMKTPINVLSIKGNHLGSEIGAPLGKFMCTGICGLDVEDIGLGSSGFLKALEQLSKELTLEFINISNNQGKMEAAKFVSAVISLAREVVSIDARYNLMTTDSFSLILSRLKDSKGKLEHLDLAGNYFCDSVADSASVLDELGDHRKIFINLSPHRASNAPYDDDP